MITKIQVISKEITTTIYSAMSREDLQYQLKSCRTCNCDWEFGTVQDGVAIVGAALIKESIIIMRPDNEKINREDVTDLDCTLAAYIHAGLVKYVEERDSCYPSDMNEVQWITALDSMVAAFAAITEDYEVYSDETQEGIELFAKYMRHLWI